MINRIYDTEQKYFECFCKAEKLGNFTRYSDDNIKDMYSHNFTYIDHDVTEEAFLAIVASEIQYRKDTGKKYLRIVTHAHLGVELLDKLTIKPEIDNYDYYGIATDCYKDLSEKSSAVLMKAENSKVAEDGRLVDIVANYIHMTLEFAIRRIDRKFEVYSDSTKPLDLYVCYEGIEPVGNCELMTNDNTAKIEDFDIIEMHQRKGYGSHVLRNLLKICNDQGIDNAYLITDHDDTAKEMYLKCGFELVGNRTELMFPLDK